MVLYDPRRDICRIISASRCPSPRNLSSQLSRERVLNQSTWMRGRDWLLRSKPMSILQAYIISFQCCSVSFCLFKSPAGNNPEGNNLEPGSYSEAIKLNLK